MTSCRAVALSLVLLLFPALVPGQEAPAAADLGAQVDAIFAPWGSPESPGCAVAVGRDGQSVLSRAYGMADLEHDVPNTPSTVFEAGSVSKQFTAAAVVLLAQQGKLSLDDDVRKHFPELPDYGAPLTVRHLMQHTSGLRDWGTVVGVAGWPRGTRIHTHAHVLDVVRRQRSLNFPPGSEYLYSNSGYNLLAMLVERVSGQSFAEFTERNLFEPLGMAHTQWRDDFTRIVKGRAISYSKEDDGFHGEMPFENVHGNGGLLTTIGDLLLWNENFVHKKVGGQALVDELERRGRLTGGREIEYAGGLSVTTYCGLREVSHSGATGGYRAFLARLPERRLSVAVLCNRADADAGALAHRVAALFLPDRTCEEPAPPVVPLTADEIAARAGLYRNRRTNVPVRLEVREGKLWSNDGAELVPLSGTLYRVGNGRSRVEFDLGSDGRPAALRLLTPDGDAIPFEPIAEFQPTPAQLADYPGEYYSDEAEAAYTVAVEEGGLVLRRRPDVSERLTPAYADAFTSEGGGLVRFLRNGEGKVTEMSFGLGRVRDLRFARMKP